MILQSSAECGKVANILLQVANIWSQLTIKSGADDYLASSEDYLMASDD